MTRSTPQVVPPEERAAASVRTLTRGIPCEGCGTQFTPWRTSQRFCRPACRPLAQRRREAERLPEVLGRLLPNDPGRAE